jgi:Arc/MetJ family transcription regulator
MRTTLNIDDALFALAVELTGVQDKNALIEESLKVLIERKSNRLLALLGGTDSKAEAIPRRKSPVTKK